MRGQHSWINFILDDVNYDVGDGICDTNHVKIHTIFKTKSARCEILIILNWLMSHIQIISKWIYNAHTIVANPIINNNNLLASNVVKLNVSSLFIIFDDFHTCQNFKCKKSMPMSFIVYIPFQMKVSWYKSLINA